MAVEKTKSKEPKKAATKRESKMTTNDILNASFLVGQLIL